MTSNTETSIKKRQDIIVESFQKFSNWEDKYRHLIAKGKDLGALDEKYKTEDLKVKGCTSQVWLRAYLNDSNQLMLEADSDAMIVKGLISLLVSVYSESDLDDILKEELFFVKDIGLQTHLSPSRANGLQAMIKQIKLYAYAYKMKLT